MTLTREDLPQLERAPRITDDLSRRVREIMRLNVDDAERRRRMDERTGRSRGEADPRENPDWGH